jgi:hypothetical protein
MYEKNAIFYGWSCHRGLRLLLSACHKPVDSHMSLFPGTPSNVRIFLSRPPDFSRDACYLFPMNDPDAAFYDGLAHPISDSKFTTLLDSLKEEGMTDLIVIMDEGGMDSSTLVRCLSLLTRCAAETKESKTAVFRVWLKYRTGPEFN